MKELNICHIINLDTIGGVEQLFSHFIDNLDKEESSRHHVLVTGNKVNPALSSYLNSLSSLNYEKFLFGMKIPKILSFLRKRQKTKLLRKNEFDRVVLWNRFDDVELIRAKVGAECKIIYYEHGASWIKAEQQSNDSFFSYVDQVFVNSHAAKRMCELKWNVKKPIFLIKNPLRPDISIVDRERTSISENPKIGFIGRLIPLKGTSILLHAVSSLIKKYPTLQLLVGGVGQEMLHLQKLASDLSIESNVEFLGVVSNVSSFYDKIDILVIPSIREPLGLVALEAQARGCPVIAAGVDGLPEVVTDKECGLCITPTLPISRYKQLGGSDKNLPDFVFDPIEDRLIEPLIVNPDKLAFAIDNLLQNHNEYIAMSKKAVSFTKKWQSFDTYTKELSDLIDIEK